MFWLPTLAVMVVVGFALARTVVLVGWPDWTIYLLNAPVIVGVLLVARGREQRAPRR